MLSTVTSFLVQNRACAIPHIGEFSITTRSAVADPVNKRFLPPVDEIQFTPSEDVKAGGELINYISKKRNTDPETAAIYLNNFGEECKIKLLRGDELYLRSLGRLHKNESGAIVFVADEPVSNFRQPVRADFVIRPDADHPVLVGDKESSASEMIEYFNEDEEEITGGRGKWWIAALLLFLLGVGAILMHFNSINYNWKQFGNGHIYQADSIPYNSISRDLK